MKNLMIAALIAIFANVGFVQAETSVSKTIKSEPTISIQEIGNFQFKIDFEENIADKVFIEVVNADGNVYFQGNYNTEKAIVLNFTNLTDGDYTISVISGKEKVNYVFGIQNHASKVIYSSLDPIWPPF